MTYSEKLKDPRWQKKRLQILERDNFICCLCKDGSTTLHVHHQKYSPTGNPWDAEDNNLVTYCEHCHAIIEFNKKHENITPITVLKREIDESATKLILVYKSEDTDLWIDIYSYKKGVLSYKTSISDSLIFETYNCLRNIKW